MKFGKVDDPDQVDFSFPPDQPGNDDVFRELGSRTGLPVLHLGCTGWHNKEWLGSLYPAGTKGTKYLSWYGRHFNTVEMNGTHYHIPGEATVQKWYDDTPEDFRFCPKFPQVISHSRNLGLGSGQIGNFAESMHGLKEKLGPCFIQLPPHFGPDSAVLLDRFLERCRPLLQLGVEVRHPEWFSNASARDRLFSLLRAHDTIAVITDVSGRRDVLHQMITSGSTIIRFVGNDLHPSDYARTESWAQRLQHWFECGLREAYVFIHQQDNQRAPELASYFLSSVQHQVSCITRGPALSTDEPAQLTLF